MLELFITSQIMIKPVPVFLLALIFPSSSSILIAVLNLATDRLVLEISNGDFCRDWVHRRSDEEPGSIAARPAVRATNATVWRAHAATSTMMINFPFQVIRISFSAPRHPQDQHNAAKKSDSDGDANNKNLKNKMKKFRMDAK